VHELEATEVRGRYSRDPVSAAAETRARPGGQQGPPMPRAADARSSPGRVPGRRGSSRGPTDSGPGAAVATRSRRSAGRSTARGPNGCRSSTPTCPAAFDRIDHDHLLSALGTGIGLLGRPVPATASAPLHEDPSAVSAGPRQCG